eukprot:391717-Ditylum_brightwellii.AAC.1
MHGFYFIFDEIITAGRTGMGTVLFFMKHVESVDFGRGESTGTIYNKAFAALNLFSKHADKAIS